MTRIAFGCLLLSLIAAPVTGSCQVPSQSANTPVELPQFWDASAKPVNVPAPNGILVLKVSGKRTGKLYPDDEWVPDYYLEMRGKRLQPSIKCYAMPHALWAPDSTWLAITSSNGGLVGNYKVLTYNIEDGKVVAHSVIRAVQADLARRFPAGINPPGTNFFSDAERKGFAKDTSWVNVRAIRWLADDELAVVASVPPSSGYGANSGKERAYVIDPTRGTIIRSYTQAER